MSNKEQETEPRLDAPGAGLPFVQEWVLKHVAFPLLRRFISWETALNFFEKQGRSAVALVRSMPEELRHQRVLVPRMLGIEDSSRYWSIMMTLDHILIVTHGVTGLMEKLSNGETIFAVVDTADVKPVNDTSRDIEQRFEVMLSLFRGNVESLITERYTLRCHEHPWFGCLNPHGWLVMLAIHQWIHKRQIETILALLPAR